MAQTALVDGPVPQDWLINEWDYRFSREIITFRNETGATASFPSGTVLETSSTAGKFEIVQTAANANGILFSPIYNLANNTDIAVLALRRGPAIVNEDQLSINGLVLATIMTALAALTPPILSMKQPTVRTDISA